MRIGKLDNDTLNALILSKFAHTRSEVLCSPQVGVDCAAVDMGGRIAVLSTDPITAADKHLGALTVHVSCNDAAAAGAEPIGLLTTLLVPPSATEDDIARVADELSAAAKAAPMSSNTIETVVDVGRPSELKASSRMTSGSHSRASRRPSAPS